MNETDFRRFIMILRSAGFVRASMIRSQNTVNFAYILYLTLRARRENPAHIETLVRRWFVMSVLTGRYTGSPETAFGVDIRNIADRNAQDYLGRGGAGGVVRRLLERGSSPADGHVSGKQPLFQCLSGEPGQGKRQGIHLERPHSPRPCSKAPRMFTTFFRGTT